MGGTGGRSMTDLSVAKPPSTVFFAGTLTRQACRHPPLWERDSVRGYFAPSVTNQTTLTPSARLSQYNSRCCSRYLHFLPQAQSAGVYHKQPIQ